MLARIDKILAGNGFGSRKDIKRLLRQEDFRVNGERITDPGTLVDAEHDCVVRNGQAVLLRTYCYLMLNKPAGVVTSTADPLHRTVMDLLPQPFSAMKLFPIGRLDIDTEGLLIITNDGALTHRLTAPKSACVKSYYLETVAPFTTEDFMQAQALCAKGLVLSSGFVCLPAQFEQATPQKVKTEWAFLMHIYEGKYHQVKKMLHALGNEVVYLRRIVMGGVKLDTTLATGTSRELTCDEVEQLRQAGGFKTTI